MAVLPTIIVCLFFTWILRQHYNGLLKNTFNPENGNKLKAKRQNTCKHSELSLFWFAWISLLRNSFQVKSDAVNFNQKFIDSLISVRTLPNSTRIKTRGIQRRIFTQGSCYIISSNSRNAAGRVFVVRDPRVHGTKINSENIRSRLTLFSLNKPFAQAKSRTWIMCKECDPRWPHLHETFACRICGQMETNLWLNGSRNVTCTNDLARTLIHLRFHSMLILNSHGSKTDSK